MKLVGCLLSITYWVVALFLSVGFVMGDCIDTDTACIAAKDANYRTFWLVTLATYIAIVAGFWITAQRKDEK